MKYYLYYTIIILLLLINSTKETKIEFLNRRIYNFNRGIEKVFLNPMINIHINIPKYINSRIYNFFYNLEDINNLIVNLYIKKNIIIKSNEIIRNSIFGFFGIINTKKNLNNKINIKNYDNIFYSYLKNNFVFLPIIGPIYIKDALNISTMQIINPFFYILNEKLIIFYMINLIDKKSHLILDSNFFYENLVDGYSFIKDIFLQNSKKKKL